MKILERLAVLNTISIYGAPGLLPQAPVAITANAAKRFPLTSGIRLPHTGAIRLP